MVSDPEIASQPSCNVPVKITFYLQKQYLGSVAEKILDQDLVNNVEQLQVEQKHFLSC